MRTRLWNVLVLLLLSVGLAGAQSGAKLGRKFDAYVTKAAQDWEVPGLAIAVVKDGEIVFAQGYGVRQRGVDGEVDENTLFAIGSTTKAMTAALLGTLVEEGKIEWDDPVIRHVPGFRLHDPYVTREVTVRDLLTHRAGLGGADLLWYGSDRTRREILDKLALVEPAYSLRAGFIYQNLMYIAAGDLAGTVSGSSWESLMEDRLFGPLGMERTVPLIALTEGVDNVARPHDRVDDVIVAIENETADSCGPAGTVWSSVSEMSRWLRMLLAGGQWDGKQVLAQETVDELLRPQTLLDLTQFYPVVEVLDPHWMAYSLGWFQIDYNGWAVSFHTGSIDGMATIVGMVPEKNLGVVVLENLDHAELRHALLWKALDLWGGVEDGRDWSAELQTIYDERGQMARGLEKQQEEARIAGTRPSLSVSSYAGTYTHELYDEIEISYGEDALHLMVGPRLSADLEHWHHDTFLARFHRRWQGRTLISFSLDATGKPSQVEIMGIAFERVPEDG